LFAFQLTIFVAIACYVGLLTADGHSLLGAAVTAIAVAIGAKFSAPRTVGRPLARLST
jgi:hypothetical protein